MLAMSYLAVSLLQHSVVTEDAIHLPPSPFPLPSPLPFPLPFLSAANMDLETGKRSLLCPGVEFLHREGPQIYISQIYISNNFRQTSCSRAALLCIQCTCTGLRMTSILPLLCQYNYSSVVTSNQKVLGSNPSWILVLAGNDLALMLYKYYSCTLRKVYRGIS